jgi:extracellular elastinolytic metalloproteinase
VYNTDLSAPTPRAGATPLQIALDYLRANATGLGHSAGDLDHAIVTSEYTDSDTGIYHGYIRQTAFGLPVANAEYSLAVAANGAVISVGGGFVERLEERLGGPAPTGPVLSPAEAVVRAAEQIGFPGIETPVLADPVAGPVQSFHLLAPDVARDEVSARLHYVPVEGGGAVLAWNLNIQTIDGHNWYDLSVDAVSGALVGLSDWVDDAGYSAVHLPHESHQEGPAAVITDAAHPVASPFGWHDTNGVAGAEFTDTRGNNVDAHLDRDANNIADVSPPRPDGGAALNFTGYVFDPGLAPDTLQNQNAAVVNLFHMNNVLHDVHYQYGFTESAGNFQQNNYGKGGAGNDAVQAQAQDGSGTNNANFATPVDGSAPRMQMYIWTNTSPSRDSDFDNGVIIHEYGHGVSNRLTGGPANSNALNSVQSGGMGEGWSDFHALMLTQRPTDPQTGTYGIGTYLLGQPQSGTGIRRFPYSFNMAVNPLTFDAFGSSGSTSYGVTRTTAVHASGEIWCSALWDLNWLLVNKHGYDSNLASGWSPTTPEGRAGNKLTMRLVMDGMKLQPANPSFTQARDAILAADTALTGGANRFEIWTAFARRGLGVNAATSGSTATTITVDTTMPMLAALASPTPGAVVAAGPTSFTLNVTAPIDPATLQASDLTVNGVAATGVAYTPGDTSLTFSFAATPVIAEGAQSLQVGAGAFTRASDASAVGALTATFQFDATPLQVVATSPSAGSQAQLPLTTIDVAFNQPLDPASVQASDLSVSQGTVTGFSLLNANTTIRFNVANVTGEGQFYASVPRGAVTDAGGNPNVFGSAGFTLDYGTVPFPTPLVARGIRGSMEHDGIYSGNIAVAGDKDNFSLSLDAGQSLSVFVDANSSLSANLTITGPGTFLTANGTTGGVAALTAVPVAQAGLYTLAVGGNSLSTGAYTIRVVLNTITESEAETGAPNDTPATAQDLAGAFFSLTDSLSRASVRGRTETLGIPEVENNNSIASATAVTQASAQPANVFQLGISGQLSSSTDADYFSIGTLQAGDVLTISESGSASGRGTSNDPLVRLYRAGSTSIIASDDDNGPGADSLLYRYTITTTDTYFVRAHRFNTAAIGTYQLGIYLENTGPAPATGGSFTTETEPNETTGTANNASASWRPVKYLASASGTITGGDADLFRYSLTAGDVVTLVARSNGTLIPQAALLDAAGNALATEDGTSGTAGPGGFSPIYAYNIPNTGDYFFRVTGASGTTGSYSAEVYLSTPSSWSLLPAGRDLYQFSLAAGQNAVLTLNELSGGSAGIAILDAGGAVVASGVSGFTNITEITTDFIAPSAGTYFAEVSGDPGVEYQLAVMRGGTFDAEDNNSFAAAQNLSAGRSALGAISGNDDWYQFNAAAGEVIIVSTETPGGGPGEFANLLDPLIDVYSPANVLLLSDDNSAADGRNARLTFPADVAGAYRVRVRSAAGSAGEYVVSARTVVNVPPPRVASVIIGTGTAQRSRLNRVVVNFDQVVGLPTNPADAFQLVRQGDNAVVGLAAVVSNSPTTSVTITATSGPLDFSSLADGRYTLTVNAAQVSSGGGGLDGNGDGTGGDNYVLVGNPTNGLFRLYGDVDGDGQVSVSDFLAFRLAFLGPNEALDFDDSSAVFSPDFIQFRLRFLQSI